MKNASKQQGEKEQEQTKQDRAQLLDTFVTYVKDVCRYIARMDEHRGVIDVRGFIEYMDEEYTEKCMDYYSDTVTGIEFRNTETGMMWMRMRNKFYHYICEERERFKHPFPTQMGMSKQDAIWLSDETKHILTKEQLTVNTRISKGYWKVHFENYVEIMDEQMYLFSIDVSW